MSKPKTILVVDDDENLRNLLSQCLQAHFGSSSSVLEASSGDAALVALEREPDIALVICDGNMGNGLDGLGLLKCLRAREMPVPFILFSGEGELYLQAARNLGAQAIEKPNFEALLKSIKAVIGGE